MSSLGRNKSLQSSKCHSVAQAQAFTESLGNQGYLIHLRIAGQQDREPRGDLFPPTAHVGNLETSKIIPGTYDQAN